VGPNLTETFFHGFASDRHAQQELFRSSNSVSLHYSWKDRLPRCNISTMTTKLYVGNLSYSTSTKSASGGGRIVLGELKEVKGAAFVDDRDARKGAEPYFAGIAESRKRSRKLQTEIDRFKKKTEALIAKLS
jgi:hypothetical protein